MKVLDVARVKALLNILSSCSLLLLRLLLLSIWHLHGWSIESMCTVQATAFGIDMLPQTVFTLWYCCFCDSCGLKIAATITTTTTNVNSES